MKLPDCQAPSHRTNVSPRRYSTRFHEKRSGEYRRLVPYFGVCAEEDGVQTSPWTPALLEEYAVQEVMES